MIYRDKEINTFNVCSFLGLNISHVDINSFSCAMRSFVE